jgi:DNA-binding response OmpR family regulator
MGFTAGIAQHVGTFSVSPTSRSRSRLPLPGAGTGGPRFEALPRRLRMLTPSDPPRTVASAGLAAETPSMARRLGLLPGAPQPRILVVDDEPPIVDLVVGYLVREGWEVRTAGDGITALDVIRDWNPHAVVLDLMLPGIDGIEVCKQMQLFTDAYVLMLTARSEEIDRIVGLTIGADDYLSKPFSPRELVARIKALLRRSRPVLGPASAGVVEGLEVDAGRRVVRVDGNPVELTALEFDLLAALAREPGIVVPRARLFDQVWGPGFIAEDHLVDVHIAKVRRKLGDDPANPRFIDTVRGVGYRLREATG